MQRPAIGVRRVESGDVNAATSVLAASFATDPVISWLIGADRDVEARAAHLFRHVIEVELAKPDHLVEIVDNGHAVAVWKDVDGDKPSPREMLAAAIPATRTFRGRLPVALKVQAATDAAHPKVPHRYLAFIGVRPGFQGKGLGGALLSSMTERCDEQGLASYLESSNPINNPLYARHGFAETGSVGLPDGAPVMASMWRDPR